MLDGGNWVELLGRVICTQLCSRMRSSLHFFADVAADVVDSPLDETTCSFAIAGGSISLGLFCPRKSLGFLDAELVVSSWLVDVFGVGWLPCRMLCEDVAVGFLKMNLLDPVQSMAGEVIFRPCSYFAFPAIHAFWMRSDAGDGAVEALQSPFASSCWISPAARRVALTWHFNGVHKWMDLLTWLGAVLPLPYLACGGWWFGLRLDGLTDVESFCRSGQEGKLPTSHADLMCGQFRQFQMEVKLKCGNAYFNCYLAIWVCHDDQARSPSCWRLLCPC
ncbi:hypothetical protein Nepgr_006571 [Nepenthes gracilis]|uniref:Uncharacterized protein n=1 Tax=Nepenthes gracilis TaxID=150966 RepID=A0AAD3S5S7_NEPGR|nr:hypothetical protein Nepgr_006571 [Nepenthes gracilis]